MSALVVADSDSYLKWAVSRALEMPADWRAEVLVVRNAVTPSAAQIEAAVDGRLEDPPRLVSLAELESRLRGTPPDILLLACRGPFIQLLLEERFAGAPPCRVAVAGIPGIWTPPTELGIELRAAVDMMIVHSSRERDELAARLPRGNLRSIGLASLLDDRPVGRAARPRVVFAPQALVPHTRTDRSRLLDALIATARDHPEVDVVIKLRGGPGEKQTHAEHASFPELAEERDPRLWPANLTFGFGPLRDYLGDCRGFVTVSSTAALEALAASVPTLILTDFGIGAETITTVFEGSGLFGTLDDLRALRFRNPDAAWLEQNYFHASVANDWVGAAASVAAGATLDSRPRYRSPRDGVSGVVRRARRRWEAMGSEDSLLRRGTGVLARTAARLRRRAAAALS